MASTTAAAVAAIAAPAAGATIATVCGARAIGADRPVGESTTLVSSFLSDTIASPPPFEVTSNASYAELEALFAPRTYATSTHATLGGHSYPLYAYDDATLPLIFTATQSAAFQALERLVRNAQNGICQHILNIEGGATQFREECTVRPDRTGGGLTRVMQDGRVFQKAGVNTSLSLMRVPLARLRDQIEHVSGLRALFAENDENKKRRAAAATAADAELIRVLADDHLVTRFTASISLVIHSVNPHVPTCHANYRFFDHDLGDGRHIWHFGGGSDLTPSVVVEEDARFFHSVLKSVCDRHDPTYYPSFKAWCDRYFRLEHRNESRGIGGIFFDDLSDESKREHFERFVADSASHFAASYFPIVLKHHGRAYTEDEWHFQQLRRGRYVEFNLLFDRGTSFGLKQPNARVESILMSLPLTCRYEFKYVPKPGPEQFTMDVLTNPRDWLGVGAAAVSSHSSA